MQVRVSELRFNILVVEDNEFNQILIRKILEKSGHMASIANNGAEALEMLKEKAFDIVLMDVMMPEIDGYETTRLIRGDTSGLINRQIPIIAMTANAMVGDREKCLMAGIDDYVAKPINTEKLFKAIHRALA